MTNPLQCASPTCFAISWAGSLELSCDLVLRTLTLFALYPSADELMARFVSGGGGLWDLEFLVNDQGRRVAAFGKSAGVVGMALGLWTWANQVLGLSPALSPLTKPYADWDALVAEVKAVTDKFVQTSYSLLPHPV